MVGGANKVWWECGGNVGGGLGPMWRPGVIRGVGAMRFNG